MRISRPVRVLVLFASVVIFCEVIGVGVIVLCAGVLVLFFQNFLELLNFLLELVRFTYPVLLFLSNFLLEILVQRAFLIHIFLHHGSAADLEPGKAIVLIEVGIRFLNFTDLVNEFLILQVLRLALASGRL